MKNKKTGIIVGVIALAALIAVMAVVFILNRPAASAGGKNITIEVTGSEGTTTSYAVSTDAEFLRQAMDETEGLTYSGTESEYGMMVEVVNGEQAIYAEDNAYWAFYVNGEYGQYGIDSQPVTDGDTYSIVYEAAAAE